MVSGEQEPTSSVVLSDWVKDVNRSLLKKLEEDLRDASTKDPKNDLLTRCMKEIAILKAEISSLEKDLRECSSMLTSALHDQVPQPKKRRNSQKKIK